MGGRRRGVWNLEMSRCFFWGTRDWSLKINSGHSSAKAKANSGRNGLLTIRGGTVEERGTTDELLQKTEEKHKVGIHVKPHARAQELSEKGELGGSGKSN